MSLPPLPLTKLIVLRSLLETENVSETARLLNRAQPSVTATLGELRDHYGDKLLVRDGARMHRSTFGETLLPLLSSFAMEADDLLSLRPDFAPKTDRRQFRIAATDYQASLVSDRIRLTLQAAPHIELDIRPLGAADQAVKSGQASLALYSGSEPAAEFSPVFLTTDDFCVLYDPQIDKPPRTIKEFAAREFVQASPGGARGGAVDDVLAKHGLARKVRVTVAPLALATQLISGSGLVTVLPISLVSTMDTRGLSTAPLPFPIEGVSTWLIRSRRSAGDKAVDWISMMLSAGR